MISLKLIEYPNDLLRQKCKIITKFDISLKKEAEEMLQIMKENNGIGLAGPQVGLLKNIIVLDTSTSSLQDKSNTPFTGAMLNPEIIWKGSQYKELTEGCLSFKDKVVKVKRPWSITVTWQTLDGESKLETFSGITARAILHETDHLIGKLFIDYSS